MSAEYWSVNGGVAARLVQARRSDALPLVVDLERALLKVNALHESLLALLLRRPFDVETLPLREDLLMWLRQQAGAGRALHLVSAADQADVERLATRLRLFDSCIGDDGQRNLQGAAKADYLRRRFPEGFSYVGGGAGELAVWRSASAAILAGAQPALRRRIEDLRKPIEAEFPVHRTGARLLLEQLRLHQWSKNLLIFLPLLLAHRFADLRGWFATLLAFAGMSLVASATYMVNDLADLTDDRRHVSKRNRPLAAGAVPALGALVMAPLLLIAGFVLAFAATPRAALVLGAYLVITLAYSFRLKRVPLLDTAVIGSLFTLRIVLGAVAVRTAPSPWLLAFSVMLFFSLAMAKRHSEITKASRSTAAVRIAGRGYEPGDVLLTLVYGIASGVASLVISMLYITNGVATVLYGNPNWLWAVPLLLYLWQMRVWLLAHRGALDDDPIVFALKDKASLALGGACLLALYLAL